MEPRSLSAPVPGGEIVGRRTGAGAPVLLLHGGPSLAYDYLDELVPELADGYDVAWYQQRSLAPSTTSGPFTIAQHVDDIATVADALGWDHFVLAGHSWGGHLVLHAALALPERLAAVLAIDPLGGVGDGGGAAMGEEMFARTPEADRGRARELEERGDGPEGTAADVIEYLRLVWPGYFADPGTAPPMPEGIAVSLPGFQGTWASVADELPGLEQRLGSITTPTAFVHGERSPIPVSASTQTAARVPGATVTVVPGAGHFVWYEAPGAVRAALDELVSRAMP